MICTICNKDKELKEFSKDKQKKIGYRTHCKKCRSEQAKEKRIEYNKVNKNKYQLRKEHYSNITEKACIECGKVKPLTEYYKELRTIGGYMNKCIECISDKRNVDYHSNIEHHRKLRRDYYKNIHRKQQEDNKLYYINLLGGKCSKCGTIPDNK